MSCLILALYVLSIVNISVDIALVADEGGQGSLLESSGQGICWHRVR